MTSIYIHGGKKNNSAIGILTHHLKALGHQVTRNSADPFEVGVAWGSSFHRDKPFLNAKVNQYDKYNCFFAFREAQVLCPYTYPVDYMLNHVVPVGEVWLARKMHHKKGKDIVVCKTTAEVRKVIAKGTHDFFSVFIPTETEYRVWVFKGKAFAIYEKVYKGEGEYEGYMRNHRFGFSFEKRDDLRGTHPIEGPCVKAVKALSMDFGAVDIIQGKDGLFYVLEVNSMPAIESIHMSSGVRLANRISKWVEKQNVE